MEEESEMKVGYSNPALMIRIRESLRRDNTENWIGFMQIAKKPTKAANSGNG